MATEGVPQEAEKPKYAAIACPAFVNGKDVLLAARKSPYAEEHVVIALLSAEARGLYEEGRLTGWKPLNNEETD